MKPRQISDERLLRMTPGVIGRPDSLCDATATQSPKAQLVSGAVATAPHVLRIVGADAVVSVIDHGEGVPNEDREAIFEPFWRKSETTPGSGLGLAIARELMEKLRGRIWVEDTPDGGATFRLLFPKAQ